LSINVQQHGILACRFENVAAVLVRAGKQSVGWLSIALRMNVDCFPARGMDAREPMNHRVTRYARARANERQSATVALQSQ
jgi:hypothetical protein